MPPPPLTDEEVRQRAQKCWDEDYRRYEWLEALGISGVGLDEADDDDLDAIVGEYQWEWERACLYGLAKDASASILAKLEAPPDPETRLADVLDHEDLVRIQRLVFELCEGSSFKISIPVRRMPHPRFWLSPLFVSGGMVCWLISFFYSERKWMGWGLLLMILGFASALIKWQEWQFEPHMTYTKLAMLIQRDAESRAKDMLEAAEKPLAFR